MDYSEYYTDCLEKVLTLDQMRLIFLMAIKDFFDKKIEIDYLSSIASRFYYDLNKPHNFNSNNELQKFGNALDDAEELEYYQENKDESESNKKMYEAMIKNLKEYLNENKDLLKNLKH